VSTALVFGKKKKYFFNYLRGFDFPHPLPEMKPQGIRWHKKHRQIAVLWLCLVVFNQGLHLVDFLWAPSQDSTCPVPTSCEFNLNGENVVQMHYGSLHGGGAVRFSVVLHDPDEDQIISRSIKEGGRGSYDSINELHSICEHNQSGYTIHCGPDKVFVEVGSGLGMVSLYAATRGMRVYAFDPLPPNIRRLDESLCLNGERRCLMQGEDSSEKRFRCSRPSGDWGSYAPRRFSRFCNLVGASRDDYGRVVESEPGNMAATMRGGGRVRVRVKVVTIHEAVRDSVIEVLLLTCQGFEYEVSA
jgi:FkbM family methyltransferase